MNNYVYYINKKIYINLTNKCSNNCDFCIRQGRVGMGQQNLWLDSPATADDVIDQLPLNLDDYDNEVVFCGFGEPTYNLEALEEVAAFLHCVDKTVRINTNGQANLIHGDDVTDVICDSCDVINVSLNAPDKVKYDKICHSSFGIDAFAEVLEFARLCKKRGSKVILSVVDTLPASDIEKCRKIAEELKVDFRVRVKE